MDIVLFKAWGCVETHSAVSEVNMYQAWTSLIRSLGHVTLLIMDLVFTRNQHRPEFNTPQPFLVRFYMNSSLRQGKISFINKYSSRVNGGAFPFGAAYCIECISSCHAISPSVVVVYTWATSHHLFVPYDKVFILYVLNPPFKLEILRDIYRYHAVIVEYD